MTNTQIMKMAREIVRTWENDPEYNWNLMTVDVEKALFAVRSDAIEECAKLCDANVGDCDHGSGECRSGDAIRALKGKK
jgi:hypothetical protein